MKTVVALYSFRHADTRRAKGDEWQAPEQEAARLRRTGLVMVRAETKSSPPRKRKKQASAPEGDA